MSDNANTSNRAKTILLIDDDPDFHDAVKAILEADGYQVRCCLTSQDGMEALRADPPDLLLLDIMLSSPTEGFHLAYQIRADERLSQVPIVMISSIGEKTGMDFAKELGSEYIKADQFMEKPFEAATLRDMVHKVLAG